MKEECDHDFDFDHCMRPSPCLKCGIEMWEVESNAIHWKKPDERPEENGVIWVLVAYQKDGCRVPYKILAVEVTICQNSSLFLWTREGSWAPEWDDVMCWCHIDEIPLPEWVKK